MHGEAASLGAWTTNIDSEEGASTLGSQGPPRGQEAGRGTQTHLAGASGRKGGDAWAGVTPPCAPSSPTQTHTYTPPIHTRVHIHASHPRTGTHTPHPPFCTHMHTYPTHTAHPYSRMYVHTPPSIHTHATHICIHTSRAHMPPTYRNTPTHAYTCTAISTHTHTVHTYHTPDTHTHTHSRAVCRDGAEGGARKPRAGSAGPGLSLRPPTPSFWEGTP